MKPNTEIAGLKLAWALFALGPIIMALTALYALLGR